MQEVNYRQADSMKTVPQISVIIPTYNAEKFISEALSSVFRQSFTDFECIVVDDGSTDDTCSIIRSFQDERLVLIENEHNFIASLNIGISLAKGKYIVRMDADDIMHLDRLKIQHAIMETEPTISVCGTWMRPFGDSISPDALMGAFDGIVELPLLFLLDGNFIYHPTTILRKEFLLKNNLLYENYPYAEDMKLWAEIAKHGGVFYIENQPLLYYRISDEQITRKKREEQKNTTNQIQLEIMHFLLDKNQNKFPELFPYFTALEDLRTRELISYRHVFASMKLIFIENKRKLCLL